MIGNLSGWKLSHEPGARKPPAVSRPRDVRLDDAPGYAARRGFGDGAHDHAGGGWHAVLPSGWPRYGDGADG